METLNIALSTDAALLDLLDKEACAINMTGLIALLPDHDPAEVKRLTNDLYMQRKINRVPVMGPKGRYYAFYSLYVRTVNGYTAPPEPIEPIAAPAPAALPETLTSDEAVNVLERAGWKAEPEVVEPILADRRAPERRRLTPLEVIKRWRLPYQLGRVVEIIGESRRAGLTRSDAAVAIRMLRDQVREGDAK